MASQNSSNAIPSARQTTRRRKARAIAETGADKGDQRGMRIMTGSEDRIVIDILVDLLLQQDIGEIGTPWFSASASALSPSSHAVTA